MAFVQELPRTACEAQLAFLRETGTPSFWECLY